MRAVARSEGYCMTKLKVTEETIQTRGDESTSLMLPAV